jgi:hypothetical protein
MELLLLDWIGIKKRFQSIEDGKEIQFVSEDQL